MNEQLVLDWGYLAGLEQSVKGSEGTGIRARWEFGCYLRDKVPRAQGKRQGPLAEISAELLISEQELRFRRQFAEQYPTETEFANALAKFESWFAIITKGLKRTPKPAATETPPPAEGKFRAIVIDPPWPVEKIQREQRPLQATWLDYQTMTLDEIEELPIPEYADAGGCHVYLWVTHKFLPFGLECFHEWDVKYECSLTWVKPTGMTPYSWNYNTEHVLFGRVGSLKLARMGLKLAFSEKVQGHSIKPDVFYERVIQASPEPRLEMFARKPREGFVVWGNEVTNAA